MINPSVQQMSPCSQGTWDRKKRARPWVRNGHALLKPRVWQRLLTSATSATETVQTDNTVVNETLLTKGEDSLFFNPDVYLEVLLGVRTGLMMFVTGTRINICFSPLISSWRNIFTKSVFKLERKNNSISLTQSHKVTNEERGVD